jgi:hypothetical protein
MTAIADALVYAVTFISLWDNEQDEFDDENTGALESIMGMLNDATDAEKDALAAAAETALACEKASPRPRSKFIQDYGAWMEEMFGEEWVGNKRRG